MTAERWKAVTELFDEVMTLPASEREAVLSEGTRDPGIEEEVRRLILNHEEASSFIETPAALGQEIRQLLSGRAVYLEPGAVICDRFEVRGLLGRGGMGAVYEVFDRELKETVALKTWRPDIALNRELMESIVREVQTARKVAHSNVCRVYDIGRHEGNGCSTAFLTMELLRGETLAARLKRERKIPEDEALPILRQVAAALDAAHKADVIHCDLKPANVILTKQADGAVRAVVTDFGLARIRIDNAPTRPLETTATAPFGTLPYMAPELLAGCSATRKCDIYSFGVVMYEMAMGRRPFETGNPVSSLARQAAGEVVPPGPADGVSRQWKTGMMGCLAHDPARRYQDASSAMDVAQRKPGSSVRVFARRRGTWIAALCVAVFSLSLLAAGLRFHYRKLNFKPGVPVVITGIQNLTGDPQLDTATLMLRSQMEQSPHLAVVPDATLRNTLRSMHKEQNKADEPVVAREVALRNGAPLVVFGNLSRLGQDYILSLMLEQVADKPYYARRSWKQTWTASRKEGIADSVHEASRWVRGKSGEAEATMLLEDRPAALTTTSSWEALQAYGKAETLAAANSVELAVATLRDAIRLDPNFALAEMRAGDLLMSIRRQEEAAVHYHRAIELAAEGHLTRREELLLRGNYASDTGDYATAEAVLKTFVQEYPAEQRASFLLAYVYRMRGRVQEAVDELWEAERKHPGLRSTYGNLVMCHLILGNLDKINRLALTLERRGENEHALHHRSTVYFLRGNYDAALGGFDSLTRSKDPDMRGRAFSKLAQSYAELGQYRRAESTLRSGIEAEEIAGDVGRKADKQLALAYLKYRQKQFGEMRGLCFEAAALDSSWNRRLKAATLLARGGYPADAHRIGGSISRGQQDQPVAQAARHRIDGEIALATGNTAGAVRSFLKADRLEAPLFHRHYLARAYAKAGEKELASDRYEKMLRSPGLFWHYADYEFPGLETDATLEAAEVTAEAQPGRACELLRSYLKLRSGADADLQDVKEARALLSRLERMVTEVQRR